MLYVVVKGAFTCCRMSELLFLKAAVKKALEEYRIEKVSAAVRRVEPQGSFITTRTFPHSGGRVRSW